MLSFSRERTAFTQASLFKKGHMSYVMALAITNVFFRINFNSLWSEWLERIKKNVSEHYYFSIHVAKTKSNCYVSGLRYINRYVMIFFNSNSSRCKLKPPHCISLQCSAWIVSQSLWNN